MMQWAQITHEYHSNADFKRQWDNAKNVFEQKKSKSFFSSDVTHTRGSGYRREREVLAYSPDQFESTYRISHKDAGLQTTNVMSEVGEEISPSS